MDGCQIEPSTHEFNVSACCGLFLCWWDPTRTSDRYCIGTELLQVPSSEMFNTLRSLSPYHACQPSLTFQRRWRRYGEAAASAGNLYGAQRGDAARHLRPENQSPEGAWKPLTCDLSLHASLISYVCRSAAHLTFHIASQNCRLHANTTAKLSWLSDHFTASEAAT